MTATLRSTVPPEPAEALDGPAAAGGVRRPPRRRQLPRWVRRVVGPLLVLALWQLLCSSGTFDEQSLPSPATVASTAVDLWRRGDLLDGLLASLRRVGWGLGLGVVAGVVLGLAAGLSRLGEDLIDAVMQMFRTIPVLALVPLFILWFGIGEVPKVLMVALATTFPVYLNLYAGIRGVDERFVELARIRGLGRLGLIRHVILPGALPAFLVGLRYSAGMAWLVLVVSEQVNARSGIGYMMMRARDFYRTDVIVVGLVIYSLLGLLSDVAVRLLERYGLAWRRGFTGG